MAFDRKSQRVSIDEAINRFAGVELSSPNRYWVVMNLPKGIVASSLVVATAVQGSLPQRFASDLGEIGIMCSQMEFPSRGLMTVESRHIGVPVKLPYSSMYNDVNFTFYCSADLRERKFFEIWQESVINVRSNSMNYYDDYVMPVHLMALNKNGDVTYQVTLLEAYPLYIGNVVGSASAKDEIQTCSVTMAYRYWINQDLI